MAAEGDQLELAPGTFRRTPNTSDGRLVETVCSSCDALVAVANNPDALRAAEAAHLCFRGKRRQASEDREDLHALRAKIARTIPETFGPVLRELKKLLQEVDDEIKSTSSSST